MIKYTHMSLVTGVIFGFGFGLDVCFCVCVFSTRVSLFVFGVSFGYFLSVVITWNDSSLK